MSSYYGPVNNIPITSGKRSVSLVSGNCRAFAHNLQSKAHQRCVGTYRGVDRITHTCLCPCHVTEKVMTDPNL